MPVNARDEQTIREAIVSFTASVDDLQVFREVIMKAGAEIVQPQVCVIA